MLSVKSEFDTAAAQERTLVGALEGGKSEALSLNRKGIEFSVLQREAESNRQVYEALLQRTKETGISGELKASNIRVVDSAEVPGGAVPAPARARPDDGGLVRRSCWRWASCSCSSTSTTASSRRRNCARSSTCRSSAWCRQST